MKWELGAYGEPRRSRSKKSRYFRNIGECVLVFAFLFILFSLVGMGSAFGASVNTLPSSRVFPQIGGILFPGFASAAGVNAAALPYSGRGSEFQGAISPGGNGSLGAFAGLATAGSIVGGGIGYVGSGGGGYTDNGLFAGAGANVGPLSFGLGLRDLNLSGGVNPGLDLSFMTNPANGLTFGGVLYDVNNASRLDLGIGYGKRQSFDFEFNVLLPTFSHFTSDYVLTGAATVYAADVFGLYLRASYFTMAQSWEESLGVLAWLNQNFNLFLQYTTPNVLTVGFSLAF